LLTDTERALDAFARLARAVARNEADAPRIAELPQLVGNWAEKGAGRSPSPPEFKKPFSAGPEETENLISCSV
jgi:hypothetical protein